MTLKFGTVKGRWHILWQTLNMCDSFSVHLPDGCFLLGTSFPTITELTALIYVENLYWNVKLLSMFVNHLKIDKTD